MNYYDPPDQPETELRCPECGSTNLIITADKCICRECWHKGDYEDFNLPVEPEFYETKKGE